MATLSQLKASLDATYPGKVLDMTEGTPHTVTRVRYTDAATDSDKAAIQAAIDAFDWSASAENLDLFFELFAKDALTGVFTPEQWATMKMLADVKTDIPFRNQVLLQVASAGTEPQRLRLAQIAAQCGVQIPTVG